MIALAAHLMNQSVVVDNASGGHSPGSARTSSSGFLNQNQDVVVGCIEERAGNVVQRDRVYIEPLQIVWYKVGLGREITLS